MKALALFIPWYTILQNKIENSELLRFHLGTNVSFNHVLIQYYRSGHDYIRFIFFCRLALVLNRYLIRLLFQVNMRIKQSTFFMGLLSSMQLLVSPEVLF